MGYPKVVIVGGGFGGLRAAQGLKKADVLITLIDKTNHHLFQPLLYQVASAALSPGNIAVPIREVLKKQPNVEVLMADVEAVDLKNQCVITGNEESFPYDYLILAPGSHHSYFGHPEWEALAPGLKTLADAVAIREKLILLSFERAERCDQQQQVRRYMRFVIIGGGPTGVEMAGSIAEIASTTLVRNFRKIRPEQTEIFLVEGASHVLPSYPEKLSLRAEKDLEKMGVRVLTNNLVTQVTPEGVQLKDRFIESSNIIWAAGNQASPLLQTLGTPLDKSGRAFVELDMSLPGYPQVFVIGDAAHAVNAKGELLPGLAPVAIQQGRYVADVIARRLPPLDRKPFRYFDKGNMATIGKAKAVAYIGKWTFSGYLAWLAWGLIHIAYLINFSNRLLVMTQWFFWYLTGQRRVRLIIQSFEDTE